MVTLCSYSTTSQHIIQCVGVHHVHLCRELSSSWPLTELQHVKRVKRCTTGDSDSLTKGSSRAIIQPLNDVLAFIYSLGRRPPFPALPLPPPLPHLTCPPPPLLSPSLLPLPFPPSAPSTPIPFSTLPPPPHTPQAPLSPSQSSFVPALSPTRCPTNSSPSCPATTCSSRKQR